jgi:hypothetical protein
LFIGRSKVLRALSLKTDDRNRVCQEDKDA